MSMKTQQFLNDYKSIDLDIRDDLGQYFKMLTETQKGELKEDLEGLSPADKKEILELAAIQYLNASSNDNLNPNERDQRADAILSVFGEKDQELIIKQVNESIEAVYGDRAWQMMI